MGVYTSARGACNGTVCFLGSVFPTSIETESRCLLFGWVKGGGTRGRSKWKQTGPGTRSTRACVDGYYCCWCPSQGVKTKGAARWVYSFNFMFSILLEKKSAPRVSHSSETRNGHGWSQFDAPDQNYKPHAYSTVLPTAVGCLTCDNRLRTRTVVRTRLQVHEGVISPLCLPTPPTLTRAIPKLKTPHLS